MVKKTSKESKPSNSAAAAVPNRHSFKQLAYLFSALILSLILFVGHFGIGGSLPALLSDITTAAVGLLSWTLLPALIIYLAIYKFRADAYKLPVARWLPASILVISLAGILHVFIAEQDALRVVKEGVYGGGYVGYGLIYLLKYTQILTSWLTFLVLFAVCLVASFTLLDLSFLEIWEFLKKVFKRQRKEKAKPLKVQEKKQSFKLKQAVPLAKETEPEKAKGSKKVKDQVLKTSIDPNWRFPPLNLLIQKQDKADAGDIQANAETIRETLANFSIDVEMEGANVGPRVTQYTLKPPSGIKLSRISGLESNIALDLAATSIRIEAPIPGKRAVGIEVPNKRPAIVRLSSLLDSKPWQQVKPGSLAFCVGKDTAGQIEVAYLDKMPHILLAGQTGSGKSVGINVLLASLLYRNSPSDLKLILVDPKQVELGPYNDIPHLLTPVINSPEKCVSALKWTVAEMESRLKEFAKFSKRNINEYNALKEQESMPYIVVVIDELADLMMVASREVEALIVRIAQKARAAGIHLVLATQRPSVDVITGLIKANVPARMAFTTASQVDSRTILDQIGAEKLLGYGDILYLNSNLPKPRRLQGALITDQEVEKVCDFLRAQAAAEYDNEIVSQEVSLSSSPGRGLAGAISPSESEDELFQEAVEVVMAAKKASTSLLQRRLRIGYARAARLVEDLEEQGIVGPADGSRPRDVLVQNQAAEGTDSDPADFKDEEETEES